MITFHFSTYPADGAAKVYEDDSWWLLSETEDTDGIEPIAFTPSDPLESDWSTDIDKALKEAGYRRLSDISYDEYDSPFTAEPLSL